MIIEWSVLVVEDRAGIFDYIEQDNPMAAIAVDERIMEQTARLARFPESGRPGRVDTTRELVIRHTPFIAVYHMQDDTVRILRILHGAQSWPDQFPDR